MTATVPQPTRVRIASRRMLLAVVATVAAIAVALTVVLALLSSDPVSSIPAPAVVPAPEWPVDPDTLSDKEKCQLAQVRLC